MTTDPLPIAHALRAHAPPARPAVVLYRPEGLALVYVRADPYPSRALLALFRQMAAERYTRWEPAAGYWLMTPATADTVAAFLEQRGHPIRRATVAADSLPHWPTS